MSEEGKEGQENKPKFRIILVGFRTQDSARETIRDLIPEAEVVSHNLFSDEVGSRVEGIRLGSVNESNKHPRYNAEIGPSGPEGSLIEGIGQSDDEDLGDTTSVTSAESIAADIISPAWIKSQAYSLLQQIQGIGRSQRAKYPNKTVVAGHGFGGIVIKQAIVIASTNPNLYNIAAAIDSMVFFATPHQPIGQQTWEGLLLDLMEDTFEEFRESFAVIPAGLVDAVANLSLTFSRYEARYNIRSLTYEADGSLRTTVGDTVQWAFEDSRDLVTPNLAIMELLRANLAPSSLTSGQAQGMDVNPK
ncbi:hypothetical protein CBS147346_3728 [Aspergillus niger]|nr:hypothetical protein CBS147346_3728 [Aspergillus niger]